MRLFPVIALIIYQLVLSPIVPALTTEEVLLLKQHGVSDKTIELMIQSEMEEKRRADSSIRITDDQSAKTYSTGKPSSTPLTREEQLNVERAWEMLKNLTIEFEE